MPGIGTLITILLSLILKLSDAALLKLNSKFLVDKWIEIAKMSSQTGKADDRVLSLVFNTFKLLLKLKRKQKKLKMKQNYFQIK